MMNLIQFKKFIKEVAENARNIDTIPKGLSPEEKIIAIESNLKLYEALIHILNISEGKKVGKDPKDKFYWLPE